MKVKIDIAKKIQGKGEVKRYYGMRAALAPLSIPNGALVVERLSDGGAAILHTTKRGYKTLLSELLIRLGLADDSALVRAVSGALSIGGASRMARMFAHAYRADGKRAPYLSRAVQEDGHKHALYLSRVDDESRAYNKRLETDPVFAENEWRERAEKEGERVEKAKARHDAALEKYIQACAVAR